MGFVCCDRMDVFMAQSGPRSQGAAMSAFGVGADLGFWVSRSG